MKIAKWLIPPDFVEPNPETDEGLLEIAGRVLDGACLGDALGDILFEGEDGKTYTLVYEAMVVEADPDYAEEVLDHPGDESTP